MLLSSRKQVRFVLCRDRLVMLQLAGGARAQVIAKHTYPYTGSETGWQPILALLRGVLQAQEWEKAQVTVILSNHFVRFLDMPWSETLLSRQEKLALVQLRFAEVYGDASAQWTFRLGEGTAYGAAAIACALPTELLEHIEALFKSTPLRLHSVQPYLMTAFNACRRGLGKPTGWFLLAERDTYCVGHLRDGQWAGIRMRQVVADWFEEAMLVLEREALLSEAEQASDVFLCAPEMTGSDAFKRGTWSVRRLHPELPQEIAQSARDGYAMAALGVR